VIPLCAALAASENGDARCALDLLRISGEIAERSDSKRVCEEHVRQASEKLEMNRLAEVVKTLPLQSKILLLTVVEFYLQLSLSPTKLRIGYSDKGKLYISHVSYQDGNNKISSYFKKRA